MKREQNQDGKNRSGNAVEFSAEERRLIVNGLRARGILCGVGAAVCVAVGLLLIVLKFLTESEVRFHAIALIIFIIAALLIVDAVFTRRKALQMQKDASDIPAQANEHKQKSAAKEESDEDAELSEEIERLEREEVKKSILSPVGLPFGIFYIILAVLLFLGAFFDWEWMGVAFRIILVLLYAALGAHAFLLAQSLAERIRAVVVFAAELVLLLWLVLSYNRYWMFACLLTQAVLIAYSVAVWLLCEARGAPSGGNFIFVVGIGIMFLFVLFEVPTIQPADEMYMAWLIIPAVIVALFAAVFIFFLFRDFFRAALKKTGELVAAVVAVLLVSYTILWLGAVCGNAAFSPPPAVGQYAVLDKEFSTGKYLDSYELTVQIDGEERDIEVSEDVYDASEIGDVIEVGYFAGGFGLPYYQYIGAAE